MAQPKLPSTSEELANIIESIGVAEVARTYGTSERNVHRRRIQAEADLGRPIHSPGGTGSSGQRKKEYADLQEVGFEAKEAISFNIKDGTILIGSDCHYWPGLISTAHRGFVKFCKKLKPKAVIMNGDVLDGATISRFPPPGWEYQPELIHELEACYDRLKEIKQAAGKARRIWTYGNHDQRFELKLATLTREYAGVKGFHLHDHFNDWERCWLVDVNADHHSRTVIKHRFKGGVHATYNNVIHSGVNMVTGHLHSAKITPKTNYRGTLYGVDCGTLAEPKGRQFTSYTEGGPTDWRSGFAVLTFKDNQLLMPELCLTVEKGKMQFRGEVFKV